MIVAVGQSACLPLRIQRNLEEQTALGALNDDEKRSGCEHGHSERQEKLFFFSLLQANTPRRLDLDLDLALRLRLTSFFPATCHFLVSAVAT